MDSFFTYLPFRSTLVVDVVYQIIRKWREHVHILERKGLCPTNTNESQQQEFHDWNIKGLCHEKRVFCRLYGEWEYTAKRALNVVITNWKGWFQKNSVQGRCPGRATITEHGLPMTSRGRTEAVLTSTHNIYFQQKYKKYQSFFIWIFFSFWRWNFLYIWIGVFS